MEVTSYALLNWFHILLFAYWLGADLGVFYGAKVMARPGLSFEDRMRVREVVQIVDMAPRSALILMLPVGFQLAAAWGSPVTGGWLLALWAGAAAWFALMWSVHLRAGRPGGELLRRSDLWVRYGVCIALVGAGLYALVTDRLFEPDWLALKVLLFGLVVASGMALRIVGAPWGPAMQALKEGRDVEAAEASIWATRQRVSVVVLFLWGLLLVLSFLGTTKPF
jgi:hypothetical protein